MNRSLKLSMLVALALGSSHAMALELGQIKVKSALGQPLLAEIPVTPESPSDLRNLRAQLASEEDFVRAGITEGRTTVPLTFSVVSAPGGGKLIRITSAAAINDPYLDLLVQVDNAAGKSVREYTILLDPPGQAATPPAPVAAAPAPAPAPVRSRPAPVVRTPAPAPAPAPAPQAAAESRVQNGKYGPVQRGQTLSSIAQNTLPAGTDLSQMLLALKQANPDAFYRDNINALKSGVVLRVPSADEARAMSVAAALAEVRRQNSDWRAGTVSAPTAVADSATRSSATSSPTTPAADRDDHLALVPSSDKKNGASGSGGKDTSVRRDLQRSQESLAALQQQGADLRSRLKDLEDINSKNERLLSLKDNEIAELQRKLAEARKGLPAGAPAGTSSAATTAPVAPAAAGSATTPPAAATSAQVRAPAMSAASSAGTPPTASSVPSAAPAPVKAAAAAKPQPLKHPVAATPTPTEKPWYMQTWAWAVGVVVVLLALLLALRGRGGRQQAKASGSSLADRFGAAPVLTEDGVDVDQEELLDQLAEHPDDIGLHLELVSLYYHRRDVEHFEAAAEAMYAHITDPQQSEWQDVAAMGEDLVPGHPLFAGVDTSVPENEREPLQGFNLDDYPVDEMADVAPVAPAPVAGPSKISEYHFDFNLTPRNESRQAPLVDPVDESVPVEPSELESFEDESLVTDEQAFSNETAAEAADAVPSWQEDAQEDMGYEPTEFSDDPIDTKLDLARAYLDMGDADGARAMLEEVLTEGSQPQRDTARALLDTMA